MGLHGAVGSDAGSAAETPLHIGLDHCPAAPRPPLAALTHPLAQKLLEGEYKARETKV